MKKIKHLLPMLLIALLLMGLLPLGAFAQEGASTDPAEATPTPAVPGDIISSGSDRRAHGHACPCLHSGAHSCAHGGPD